MKRTVGFKAEDGIIKDANVWCDKNATTLPIQLRNFLKYLADEKEILKGGM